MDELEYTTLHVPREASRRFPELQQLMCVALSDPSFAVQLLSNPTTALAQTAPTVELSAVERALVTSITGAVDIHDFAARLHLHVQQAQANSLDPQPVPA